MSEYKNWDELSRKEQLETTVWDMYKEAHGIRPRHLNLAAMTEDELQATCKRLEAEIEMADKARSEAEAKAVVRLSKRVEDTIKSGAGDRETALRWIMEADAVNGDWEFLAWINGLPYGFFKTAA